MDEGESGNLKVIIARTAEFCGLYTPSSSANVMAFKNFRKGKKAQLPINDNVSHPLTCAQGAAQATAILGNTTSACKQVWQLSPDRNILAGREFIERAAKVSGA